MSCSCRLRRISLWGLGTRVHFPCRSSVHAPTLSDSAEVEHELQLVADLGRLHLCERLDAVVEIALHHVGAADVDLLVAAVLEVEDARVLEEAADDAAYA